MRRFKRRKDSHSVSLFPFLAVLICTFGVLIVLLVLVVKAADHQAVVSKQEVYDRNANEIEELAAEVQLQEIRVEGLRDLRPDLLKNLQQARQQRAHLQSRIKWLTRDAQQLDAQIRLVTNESEISNDEPSKEKLLQLQQELDAELAELQNRRQTATSHRPTKYSIVPHDGPDGTQRRPVYIECLSDKLVIQPYDIALTADDFVQPVVANNPLDAALIAVREYFLENKLNEVGQTPYPLLIVRPEGAEFYSLARHAIRSWDEEFGYELITAEKLLDFGDPDPQLNQKMLLAIEAAKKRQRAFVAEQMLAGNRLTGNAADGSEQSGVRGLQASSQLGGFVGPDGTYATNRRLQEAPEEKQTGTSSADGTETERTATDSPSEGDGNGQSSMVSIAEKKGNNWALPNRNDRATGYRRPVVILLTRHEMIVNPNAPYSAQHRIKFTQPLTPSLERLVTTVWQQVESWGVAGVNSYWMPELVIRIEPGAGERFRQVVEMMKGSGIDVREVDQ